MEWFDLVLIAIIALSIIISLVRGFVREALSLGVWIAAFFVASQFYHELAAYFTRMDDPMIRNGVAIAILFVVTLIAGAVIVHLISSLVENTGLTGTDRLLGGIFGALRGVLVVSAFLFFADAFTPIAQQSWWQQSSLVPHFSIYIQWFFEYFENSSSFLQQS